MKPTITQVFDQPQVAPWMMAKSRANSEMAMVICPGQSSSPPPSRPLGSSYRRPQ